MNIETYPPEQTPEILNAVPPSPNQPRQAPLPPRPPQAPIVPPPPAPEKQRRVGTFTLGVTLIMLGILVPLSLVVGGGMWKVLQFAPLVLLVLGVEILVYAIRFKSEKFRYDGVSVFLVVMITFVTLLGSLLAPPIFNVMDYAHRESVVCEETRSILEQEVAASNSTGNVGVYSTDSSAWQYVTDHTEPEVWRLNAYVHFGQIGGEETADKSQVARVFASVAAAAAQQKTVRELSMEYTESGPDGVTTYRARLLGNMVAAIPPENMEKWITTAFEPNKTQPSKQGSSTTRPTTEETAVPTQEN